MSSLVPETATRLQATAFVTNAELSAIGRDHIIRAACKEMAERALRKLIKDCIKTGGDYMGHVGQTLVLDVYVLSPADLHRIIAQAREEGGNDARRWTAHNA